jgi:hypothetical protein
MLSDYAGVNVPLVILLAVVNIPIYWLLFRTLFDDVDELFDAIKFWITPEIFSAMRGEYLNDIWAELKLILLVGGCVALVVVEYAGLQSYLANGGGV